MCVCTVDVWDKPLIKFDDTSRVAAGTLDKNGCLHYKETIKNSKIRKISIKYCDHQLKIWIVH